MAGRKKGSVRGKHRYMTEAEMMAFMKAAKKACREEWLMMALAYYYGLRVNELASLRWEQVDLRSRKIAVIRSKGGADESYLLTPELMRSLLKHSKARREAGWGGEWLFPARRSMSSAHVTEQTCKNIFYRIAATAGVEGKSIHSLRHSCAMERAFAGATAIELAGWLGHRQLGSVNEYITAARRSQREAALAPIVGRYLR